MKEDNKNKINRRDFFKLAGAGTLASAAALYGCSGNKNNGESESAALGEIPTDKMTYRTNPNTGDRVSLLGYGCMRWPTRKRADGNGDEIDQEAVNDLIDYAIAHGVNYFDTSPAYVQGLSERATGIALKRHPREKFFLATKLSNFSPSTHSREESLAEYHLPGFQFFHRFYDKRRNQHRKKEGRRKRDKTRKFDFHLSPLDKAMASSTSEYLTRRPRSPVKGMTIPPGNQCFKYLF